MSNKSFCYGCNEERILVSDHYCRECHDKCKFCGGGDLFPHYGLAPPKPKKENRKEWHNKHYFVEDPEWQGMGLYYCPVCRKGKEETIRMLTRKERLEAFRKQYNLPECL